MIHRLDENVTKDDRWNIFNCASAYVDYRRQGFEEDGCYRSQFVTLMEQYRSINKLALLWGFREQPVPKETDFKIED